MSSGLTTKVNTAADPATINSFIYITQSSDDINSIYDITFVPKNVIDSLSAIHIFVIKPKAGNFAAVSSAYFMKNGEHRSDIFEASLKRHGEYPKERYLYV